MHQVLAALTHFTFWLRAQKQLQLEIEKLRLQNEALRLQQATTLFTNCRRRLASGHPKKILTSALFVGTPHPAGFKLHTN